MARYPVNAAIQLTLCGPSVDRDPVTGFPVTSGDQSVIVPCWAEFVADRARELTKRAVSDERVLEIRGVFRNNDPEIQGEIFTSGLHPFWMAITDLVATVGECEIQPLGTSSLRHVRARLGTPFVIRGRSQVRTFSKLDIPVDVRSVLF